MDNSTTTEDWTTNSHLRLVLDRPVLTVSECYQIGSQEAIPSIFDKDQHKSSSTERIGQQLRQASGRCCSRHSLSKFLLRLFPCVGWGREYTKKWRQWLVPDIISGITAAVYQVPQGLGNGLLANVPPVMGLYASFFPALIYSFMGTSRQTSMGTFTVLSLLMGRTVTMVTQTLNSTETLNLDEQLTEPYSALQVAITAAVLSGCIQVILGLVRMGALSILISPSLANGFMAGCAFQIAISQLKGMFALTYPNYQGPFSAIYTLIDFCKNVRYANEIDAILSVSVVVFLIVCKDFINPHFLRFFKAPLPADLLVVIISTVISYLLDLKECGVATVNHLPLGLPSPVLPNFGLFGRIFTSSLSMALVGFAITFSMGKNFAKKYDHQVDANQEFLALGAGNIFGGFFLSIPSCGSLARSSVLESVKCKTQLHAMLSCAILLVVFYFIGPLLEPLPNCVLAASIATAVKGYFFTLSEIWHLWPVSRADALVWATTCVAVVVLDVSTGLITGVIVALFSISWKMHTYKGRVLREISSLGLYLPQSKQIKNVTSTHPGQITIYRFGTPMCFVTAGNFEHDILRILKQCTRYKDSKGMDIGQKVSSHMTIVVDCSSICFVDSNGVETMKTVISKCHNSQIPILLAAVPDTALKTLENSGTLLQLGYTHLFPSIQDAVCFAQESLGEISTLM